MSTYRPTSGRHHFPLSAGRALKCASLPGLRNELFELAQQWDLPLDDDGLKELLRVAHDPDDGCVVDAPEVLTFARLALAANEAVRRDCPLWLVGLMSRQSRVARRPGKGTGSSDERLSDRRLDRQSNATASLIHRCSVQRVFAPSIRISIRSGTSSSHSSHSPPHRSPVAPRRPLMRNLLSIASSSWTDSCHRLGVRGPVAPMSKAQEGRSRGVRPVDPHSLVK